MSKSKSGPAAHTRTHDELIAELRSQLKALGALAGHFRDGEQWAAKLMATVMFVICHDGSGKTRSLLTQLGFRRQLKCINTAQKAIPGNLVTMPLMLGFRFGPDGNGQFPRFLMPRDESQPFEWVPFTRWWEQPIYSQGKKNIVSRKELVLAVRSKDGGGHFDSELDCANYVNMTQGSGWENFLGDEVLPRDPSHLITIWAMGWELVTSLNALSEQLEQQRPATP